MAKKIVPVKTPLVVLSTNEFNGVDAPAKYMVVELTSPIIKLIKKLRKVVTTHDILIAEVMTVPNFKYINDLSWLTKAEQKKLAEGETVLIEGTLDQFLDLGDGEEFTPDSTTLKVSSHSFTIVEYCDDGQVFADASFACIEGLL